MKHAQGGDGAMRTEAPLSSEATKTTSKAFEPPSAGGANDSPSQAKAPGTSGTRKSAKAALGPTSSKSRKKKMAPLSPQMHKLNIASGAPGPSDSASPSVESLPRVFSRVADSLEKDPDFIKTGFHIGRFLTAAVNTEAEQSDIQALWAGLDSTSLQINVSTPFLFISYRSLLILTPFPIQKIIEHFESKDKFQRVCIQRLSEGQNIKDELK
jgi:hypothetical protein